MEMDGIEPLTAARPAGSLALALILVVGLGLGVAADGRGVANGCRAAMPWPPAAAPPWPKLLPVLVLSMVMLGMEPEPPEPCR